MRAIDSVDRTYLLTHPTAQKILEGCQGRAKSLADVSSKEDIPLSKCYKIAYRLVEMNLLKKKKVREGTKIKYLYRTIPDLEFTEHHIKEKKSRFHKKDRSFGTASKIKPR